MTLSLDDVRNKRFRMARKSGYEVLEVDEFVDEVEATFEQLFQENQNLRKQVESLKSTSSAPQAETPAATGPGGTSPAASSPVVAELVYSVTDPPLRALRKVLRPVRVGNVQLDLAFIGLYILVSILMRVNRAVFF